MSEKSEKITAKIGNNLKTQQHSPNNQQIKANNKKMKKSKKTLAQYFERCYLCNIKINLELLHIYENVHAIICFIVDFK